MNENMKITLELDFAEYLIVAAGVGAFHQRAAQRLADTLADKIEKESDQLSVDEFDETHKQIMTLYDKLAEAYKEAEANEDDREGR